MLGSRSVILVVDDEECIRSMIGDELSERGYEVLFACDGDTAWKTLRGDTDIDLVLTDVMMPGNMNGLELVEKAIAWKPHLRTVVMSGYINDDIARLRCADFFLQKPFSLKKLETLISKLLLQ